MAICANSLREVNCKLFATDCDHPAMNTTDLITAAQQGNLEQVIACVENGADPKLWNSQALSEAAIHNHLEVVKYLTPLSDVNVDCAVALRNAFVHNNTDVINFLWDQVDHELVIQQTEYALRPLPFQLACQYGFYNHALSLFKYPFTLSMIWRSHLYLPQVSNDPACLQLWDQLLTRLTELGEDPARVAVGSWYNRTLPGLNILKIMAQHSSGSQKMAQHFLKYLAANWSTENHVSAVFPIFKHRFEGLDDETKQSVIAKTIPYNPVLARDLIEQTPNLPLLCAPVVNEALRCDVHTLMDMILIWKRHTYKANKDDFSKVEGHLMSNIVVAPEKVWCVVENFNQFLTADVARGFIDLHEDGWTQKVCAHTPPQEFNRAQGLLSSESRNYLNEYKNRVQHTVLTQELSHCVGSTVSRKI